MKRIFFGLFDDLLNFVENSRTRVQIKKYIAILLFFCFAVYLGHNLIPHQHHSEIPVSADAHSCPLDHQNQHDHNTGTKHCHAFNDINFVKDGQTGIPGPVSINTNLDIAFPATVPGPAEEAELSHKFRLKPSVLSVLCSGPPSLRAPPSLV